MELIKLMKLVIGAMRSAQESLFATLRAIRRQDVHEVHELHDRLFTADQVVEYCGRDL